MRKNIHNLIAKMRYNIRWVLFITLGSTIVVSQVITVFWLWYESREQIEILTDTSLTLQQQLEGIRHEEFESIMLLLGSALFITAITLLFCYYIIRKITRPLESLEQDLLIRSADNLSLIESKTEMKEIQTMTLAINRLFTKLDASMQQERLFTADVAHELRTPLAGIRLHLELIEKNHHVDCRDLILRLDRLVQTVYQLLTLSRNTQKFIVGQHQQIFIYDDIYQVLLSEFNDMARDKNQHINWRVDPYLSMQGDLTLLRLMLRNIVENACRYSPENTDIAITITLVEKNQNNSVLFKVCDQGTGIKAEQIELLTQPFVRMDRRGKGIGLGLSIVKRIIALHKGTLVIQNQEENIAGAIIECYLPQKIEGS